MEDFVLILSLPKSPKIKSVGNNSAFALSAILPSIGIVNSNGAILLSQDDAPTPFVVELRVPLGLPSPTVLIGADDIVISVPAFSGNGKFVSNGSDNALVLSERREVFKFGDLVDSIERANSGQPQLFRLFKNDQIRGEVWEFGLKESSPALEIAGGGRANLRALP